MFSRFARCSQRIALLPRRSFAMTSVFSDRLQMWDLLKSSVLDSSHPIQVSIDEGQAHTVTCGQIPSALFR